jgi:alpha-tubulin suppressor-like RCC1 family protein
MKVIGIVLGVTTTLLTFLSPTTSHATTRARFVAETILNDASVRISAGGRHTCQVNEDGTVRCWGANDSGQLGNGTTTTGPTVVPVLVSGINTAVAISAGAAHTCALLADGSARCWGSNFNGQIGDGTRFEDRPTPVAVSGLTNAVAIAAGGFHTCALLADGSARCWGSNFNGQIGDGTSGGNRPTPVAVTGLTNAVAITAGGFFAGHTCALLADGTARCWGFNFDGQIGDGTSGGNRPTPAAVTGLTNAVAITAGDTDAGSGHTCALLADGTASCWGSNKDGEVGDGTSGGNRPTPVAVTGLSNVVAVAGGDAHTCALLASGTVRCWGNNTSGQLGDGSGGGSFTARDIAAGRNHTCAVRANSTVSCWGSNGSGQIGDGTSGVNRLSPVTVPGLSNVVAVAGGDAHTCALLASGTVRCWGLNTSGQLGNGTFSSSLTPVPVSGLTNVVAIAAGGALGSSHTCALLADSTARCWGANGSGQLGDNTTANQSAPVLVRTLSGVFFNAVAIAVGEFYTCALLADGTVNCWGANDRGQLGDDTFTGHLLPALVKGGLANAVALAGGDFHACALLADGGARCWGENGVRQLGNDFTNQKLPSAVLNLSNAVAIAGGFLHTCALVANGGARCWGDNSVGQLGNPTTSLTPPTVVQTLTSVKVRTGGTTFVLVGLTRAVNITAGRRHSCALIANGGVSCWGENTFGQLGLGSTVSPATSAHGVPSFTLNIDPAVTFKHNSRVTTVTVVATCEAGQQLHVDVTLTQDAASGHGVGHGECTGGLERYEVTVPAQGRNPLIEGPAAVEAEARFLDRGFVVDTQEWTREVQVVSAP